MNGKKEQIYEVEIRSRAILKEGMRSLITYFKAEPNNEELIAKNVGWKYPQYTRKQDKAEVDITPISQETYNKRLNGGVIKQKRQLVQERANVFTPEDIIEMNEGEK